MVLRQQAAVVLLTHVFLDLRFHPLDFAFNAFLQLVKGQFIGLLDLAALDLVERYVFLQDHLFAHRAVPKTDWNLANCSRTSLSFGLFRVIIEPDFDLVLPIYIIRYFWTIGSLADRDIFVCVGFEVDLFSRSIADLLGYSRLCGL